MNIDKQGLMAIINGLPESTFAEYTVSVPRPDSIEKIYGTDIVSSFSNKSEMEIRLYFTEEVKV